MVMSGVRFLAFASLALATPQYVPPPPEIAAPQSPTVPRVYQNDGYSSRSAMDITENTCVRMRGDFYHNIGSISVPCASHFPEGKKMICTIYQSSDCTHSDASFDNVAFDHSHFRMFDSSSSDGNGISDVGGLTGSVKCEVVDKNTVIKNTYNVVSTTHASTCVDEPCKSNNDCIADEAGQLYCAKSGTCQRAKYVPDGYRCNVDQECQQGYCTGLFEDRQMCAPLRRDDTECSAEAECANKGCCVGLGGGPTKCYGPVYCRGSSAKPCTLSGEFCLSGSSCCSGVCHPSQVIVPVCQ